ncbi:MAG: RsmD family RNA methyltransferase [Bdellovibrionales bacterium]
MQTCNYSNECSGCPNFSLPIEMQKESKVLHLYQLAKDADIDLGRVSYQFVKSIESRDRVDFSVRWDEKSQKSTAGFFDRSKMMLLDIEKCVQLTPNLQNWYELFRAKLPRVDKLSVRLRVSPVGERGVWLDTSNLNIKKLLEERVYLDWLLSVSKVEIGQKRKRLVVKGEKLKLVDPQAASWWQSFIGDELKPANLKCLIGGFTQTGFENNKMLVGALINEVPSSSRVLELCGGIGNLGLALASCGSKVISLEMDRSAVVIANENSKNLGLAEQYNSIFCNIHKKSADLLNYFKETDVMVVDPPRSGLKASLDILESLNDLDKPKKIIYMSCHGKSLVGDLQRLVQQGYKIIKTQALDQFVGSEHCEYLVTLDKI